VVIRQSRGIHRTAETRARDSKDRAIERFSKLAAPIHQGAADSYRAPKMPPATISTVAFTHTAKP
jgi:hypothetical protein